jgi:hypothetical protein
VAAVAVSELDRVTTVTVSERGGVAAVAVSELNGVTAVAVSELNGVTAVATELNGMAAVATELNGVTTVATELDRVTAVTVTELDRVTAVFVVFDSERAECRRMSVGRSRHLKGDKSSEAQCPQDEQRRSQRCIHWFLLNQVSKRADVSCVNNDELSKRRTTP